MAVHQTTRTMFHRLIALTHRAFAAGHYPTAYHTLAAALHEAHAAQDADGLALVQQIAEAQGRWIDCHAPEDAHSTQSAAARGQSSPLVLLVYEAQAKGLLVQQRHRGCV